jgi:hypothetical protein
LEGNVLQKRLLLPGLLLLLLFYSVYATDGSQSLLFQYNFSRTDLTRKAKRISLAVARSFMGEAALFDGQAKAIKGKSLLSFLQILYGVCYKSRELCWCTVGCKPQTEVSRVGTRGKIGHMRISFTSCYFFIVGDGVVIASFSSDTNDVI